MEYLKVLYKSVRSTLFEWNYGQNDIVHAVDLGCALHRSLGKMSYVYKYHILCMCLCGELVDYGDGLYGINEEPTT